MAFSIIPRDDPRQALRIRRSLLALSMAGIHLVMCCAMYYQGLFRLSFTGFVIFTIALWTGHFSILTVLRTGFNKRFADPSLTFFQILWTATCVMLTAYFINGLRPVVLMLFLVGMLFGFLRLNFKKFLYLGLYAMILYGVVIGLLYRFHPQSINLDEEIIIWICFSLVTFCFSLMGREISHMRETLRAQNIQLREEVGERKQAQEELQFRKAYFEGLVDNIPDGIAIFDDDGTITEVNSQFVRMFGYPEEEALGQHISELVGDPDRAEEVRAYRRRIASGGTLDVETVRRKKDGSRIDVSLRSAAVVVGESRVGHFVIYRDISFRKQAEQERSRLESQVQHSRKMEAIATLAGGIAHRFNNALTPIIGNIELLEMQYHEDREMAVSLKDMKSSGRLMAHLTSQLLAYARGGKYHPQTMSLTDFVQGTLPIVEPTLKPEVRIETDLPVCTRGVELDPTQMQMVLSAVVANSNDAIEGKGRIRVSARDLDLDDAFVKAHPELSPGAYVSLTVADDGKGMDEETKNKMFEPFFTTHFIGRGLGMAAVYGIVTNHGGSVTVDSKLGSGTTVRIYLPVARERSGAQGAEIIGEPAMETPWGEGTILVIEDEAMVIDLTRAILERLGYRVLEARTGKAAVETARTFNGRIDLALLDIKLPDMPGNQVYPLIKEARQDLKVVVCSGYAIDGPAQEILDAGAEGFIQKPFSVTTLGEKMQAVLGGK
ncbi:MAG: PAS domain S-box protein [Deltaproteobacteria bacterium]|nr:PAS domain S-box protein [Deltaproteobacteria bacterium]